MRHLYSLLGYLALPLVLARLFWRSRQLPAYRQRIAERFGWVPRQSGVIWLHTVSVGETLAATRLVAELQSRYPGMPLLMTCMTPTGSVQIRKSFPGVAHCYAPYDLPDCVNRFVQRVQPRLLILLETELWPNWLATCQARQIPVALVNGRLSERSCRGYQKFSRLFEPLWPALSVIAAQYADDARRFAALNIRCPITACGSLKFDLELPDSLTEHRAAQRQQWAGRPVWIAGCTHEGEEAIVLAAHRQLLRSRPDALLVLVPRHPDRFERVARLVEQSGFSLSRRSRQQVPQSQVYLADTMGELLLLYACADLSFVGGSLVDTGGHNLLEPAAVGVPVLTGPSHYNFARISELFLQADALIQVRSAGELAQNLELLWQNPTQAERQAQAALQVVAANRGALQRVITVLTPWLERAVNR